VGVVGLTPARRLDDVLAIDSSRLS